MKNKQVNNRGLLPRHLLSNAREKMDGCRI